jgi:hypothetical protein
MAERKILEAIEKGELDDYEGKGEPFPEEFFQVDPFVPDDLKQTYRIFKNASILPPEIILKRRIEEIKVKLKEYLPEAERENLLAELRDKETEFNVKIESLRTLSSRK